MSQIRTILFEGIERHIIFINKFFYDFLQWLETWSIICIICPTLCDYFGQFCRTNCWNSQMTSFMANNIFNLIVVFFSIRRFPWNDINVKKQQKLKTYWNFTKCHNLPNNNTKRPYITLSRKFGIHQSFWRHPLNWKCSGSGGVIIFSLTC